MDQDLAEAHPIVVHQALEIYLFPRLISVGHIINVKLHFLPNVSDIWHAGDIQVVICASNYRTCGANHARFRNNRDRHIESHRLCNVSNGQIADD